MRAPPSMMYVVLGCLAVLFMEPAPASASDGGADLDVVMLNSYDAPSAQDPPPHQFLLLKDYGT